MTGPGAFDRRGGSDCDRHRAAGSPQCEAAGQERVGPDGPIGLDTLVRLQRRRPAPDATRRLPMPDGMTAPLGCDAVAVPDRLGPLVVPRLPRLGCVYADGSRWWWIVPADSDYALPWPSPAQYAPGALVTGTARLIHRPEGPAPYTPPIPLYLALCRVTGTTPDWSSAVSA
ncbi:hypothetical protein GCM10010503_52050 [Streptomyces lucensis JCM 4490]|uniref:Uncharacterized protein n=1 Tax=Streptomyces lucensis JCM 4490 TaxID=1306176 RepID=A0A918JCS5_9ACTN|nr:hypothetical protein GCM10010503_52050 [Streptomyces lucensis JCM 4490]